jgi:chemotaxis protein CheX
MSSMQIPRTLMPFINGVVKTFKVLCSLDVEPQNPLIKKGKKSDKAISGIIGMVGENHIGSFAISFTKDCILRIVKKMLGEDYNEINTSVADTVAEITNIVFGNAKRELAEMNISLEMAIPYTVTGENHIISHKSDGPFVVVPFKCEHGEFTIEIGLELKKGK